jgi:alkaline phosphatase D
MPLHSFNRREFVSALGAWGLIATLPNVRAQSRPRFNANPFSLGVASGYPEPDGFVLWTRLAPDPTNANGGLAPEPIEVRWEVARDEALRDIAAKGVAVAAPDWAHSIHVEVQGLEPGRPYWYRFTAGEATSPIGRTRTAPAHDALPGQLRYILASCQHYEQGWFSAYRHALADDPDLVLFVGDYIYEQSFNQRVRSHGMPKAFTLDDFRRRYALYKGDPDLQALHAACPWLLTWDDHEVENDYANDQSIFREVRPEQFLARRAGAYKAYYEHMPLRSNMRPSGPNTRIYTSVPWGRLARINMLDGRQYRTPQPCQRADRGGGNYLVNCGERTRPEATMLGFEQERWLDENLAQSSAQWNLLAQQTLFAQLDLSMGEAQSFWTDAWDGYPAARKRIMESLQKHRVRNPVVLGGDTHMFWASELPLDPDNPGSAPIATDLCTSGVTSRTLVPQWALGALLHENPHIQYANTQYRGYLRATVTPRSLVADLRGLDNVENRDTRCNSIASFIVEDGRPSPRKI